ARGRAEVSVGGEHRADDGDREDRAEALHHVVDAGRLAEIARVDGVQHGGRHGRQRHRDADAGDQQGDVHLDPTGRQRAPGGDPANPAVCKNSPVTMTGRRPTRSETTPAIGEINIGVAKNGSRRTPAETGEYPRASWNSWVTRKPAAKIAPFMRKVVALPTANARRRNSRSGTIGSRTRRSQAA